MELYARVRRAVQAEGISEREAARQFGLARETVRKMLRYSIPPGYRRQQPARRPKLDAWVGIIDQILEQDKAQSKKQRHTAKRVFERLREEHGFPGGYTIVKDYVRLRKLSQREMFVPLEHPPGEAQADFGEAQVVIGGVERKAHYFVMELPQSDDCFVMAFPAETTEAFLAETRVLQAAGRWVQVHWHSLGTKHGRGGVRTIHWGQIKRLPHLREAGRGGEAYWQQRLFDLGSSEG